MTWVSTILLKNLYIFFYIEPSPREREKREKQIFKQHSPAPTASTVDPCLIIQISRSPNWFAVPALREMLSIYY